MNDGVAMLPRSKIGRGKQGRLDPTLGIVGRRPVERNVCQMVVTQLNAAQGQPDERRRFAGAGGGRDSDQVSLRKRTRTWRRPRPRHNLILLLRQRDAVDRPLDGRQLEVVGIVCSINRVPDTIFRPWFLLGALHLYLLLSLALERPNAIRLHPLPLFGC